MSRRMESHMTKLLGFNLHTLNTFILKFLLRAYKNTEIISFQILWLI